MLMLMLPLMPQPMTRGPSSSATAPTRIAPIEATEIENEAARHQVIDKILKYNEEDLAATWAVLQWVRDFGRGGAHGVCE